LKYLKPQRPPELLNNYRDAHNKVFSVRSLHEFTRLYSVSIPWHGKFGDDEWVMRNLPDYL